MGSTDVAVVGAGLAGLTAAWKLTEGGADVIVLEARDRVGGRLHTVSTPNGISLDLGGQWIGPSQTRMQSLAATHGLPTVATYNQGDNLQDGPRGPRRYSGAIPATDPELGMQLVEQLLALNLMAGEVPLDAPWRAAQAASWDAFTVGNWLEREVASREVRDLLTLAVRSVFCVEPHELSFLHFLFYVHSAGSLNELISVARGAQERRFAMGAQTVAEKLADRLGDRVRLNTPITSIRQDDGGVELLGDEVRATCRFAIVAVPPAVAAHIAYHPSLPEPRFQLMRQMTMGNVIKVVCVYEEAFWRGDGLSGQAAGVCRPLSVTFDNSPDGGRPAALLGFFEGEQARRWAGRPAEERRAQALADLAAYFGEEARRPSEYFDLCWADEPYTRGGYAGVMRCGMWTSLGPHLRAPVGRLHWAGTETATRWNGYMEGAVESGERAADEVYGRLP